jgi:hypothetical protein
MITYDYMVIIITDKIITLGWANIITKYILPLNIITRYISPP